MKERFARWKLRGLRIAARLRIRGTRIWEGMRGTPLGILIERVISGFTAIEPFDRAMTLAAQAFTSRRADHDRHDRAAAEHRGLRQRDGRRDGAVGRSVQKTLAGSVPSGATVVSGVGFFGFLVAFFSATAYSRALERMYLKIWQVPKPPLRTAWRWIATIVAVMLAVSLLALTQDILANRPVGTALEVVIRLVIWFVVWTYVPWVLMRTKISLRALAFTGAVTSLALTVLAGVGSLYLPIVLTAGAEEFGVLGLVFAYIGWLFVLSFAIVLATVVGRACAQDEGMLGRLVRGPSPRTPTCRTSAPTRGGAGAGSSSGGRSGSGSGALGAMSCGRLVTSSHATSVARMNAGSRIICGTTATAMKMLSHPLRVAATRMPTHAPPTASGSGTLGHAWWIANPSGDADEERREDPPAAEARRGGDQQREQLDHARTPGSRPRWWSRPDPAAPASA